VIEKTSSTGRRNGLSTLADRLGDEGVQGVVELLDLRDPLGLAGDRVDRRAADDRGVVAVGAVLGEELADLELDEVEELGVLDEVALVEEDDDLRHVHLAGQEDVLAGLRHRAVDGRHHEDRAVHLRGARDHVLHVVGVPGQSTCA
jgi:hypothetical protein